MLADGCAAQVENIDTVRQSDSFRQNTSFVYRIVIYRYTEGEGCSNLMTRVYNSTLRGRNTIMQEEGNPL